MKNLEIMSYLICPVLVCPHESVPFLDSSPILYFITLNSISTLIYLFSLIIDLKELQACFVI